jgi:peptidoglycan/LPS O-acetylase OafA/YrhL
LWAAAIFVALSPLIRLATLRGYLPQPELIGETFQTIGDSIAVGCLLAGLRDRVDASVWYQRFANSPLFLLVPCVVVADLFAFRWPTIDYAVAQPASNIAIALMIHWAVIHHDGVVGRILNFRPLVFIGTLSYSVYLWQQLFINRNSTAFYCRFPQNIGFACAAGAASFYLIEQPMLRLRERLEPRLFARRKQGT